MTTMADSLARGFGLPVMPLPPVPPADDERPARTLAPGAKEGNTGWTATVAPVDCAPDTTTAAIYFGGRSPTDKSGRTRHVVEILQQLSAIPDDHMSFAQLAMNLYLGDLTLGMEPL